MLLVTTVTVAAMASAAAAGPALGPANTVIDGPSPDVISLSGMSIARADGTGGLVYLKNVGGVAHVFVSRLLGGAFRAPEQVDASLAGASSQPVIGAGKGGLLLVAFINAGQLYVVDAANAASPFGAPLVLAAGAMNPALAISTFSKAYLAFTVLGAGGHDVRAAYYDNGQWALESSPLDANPADDAGTGTGRPAVAAAGDGVGIVVWGEGGHIDSRRVWGTAPSVVFEQADVPSLGGWSEVSADEPSAGVGGDSSFVVVAFHEVLASGSVQQSRVLANRLQGSQYDGVTQPDGLTTPGPESADQPQVGMTEFGRGFVTSARAASNQLFATGLSQNGVTASLIRVDSLQNSAQPDAVPAAAGLYSTLIAWQQDPALGGAPEIHLRYAQDGFDLGPELVISSPTLGPVDAADGLAAGGDGGGDAAVAWAQGATGSMQIVAAQFYQPPGSIAPPIRFRYARNAHPAFSWSPARDMWGPVRYLVTVDSVEVAQTTGTSIRVPAALPDGPHSWQVTAVNPAGLPSAARPGEVWVDTIAPLVSFTITGRRQVGSYLHINVKYTDSPPPLPPADASGIARVTVKWGDRSSNRISRGKYHAFKRRGRYLVSVIVKDRAGNTTTLARQIKIVPKPKPKPKKRPPPAKKP